MGIQYFIVAAIVIVVLIWQYKTYRENQARIDSIKHLFPIDNTTKVEVDNGGRPF